MAEQFDPQRSMLTTAADAAAKDSPAGAESTLSSAVLDLLAAIRDAADVPLPSLDLADEHAWHQLTARRLSDLHTTLSVALDPKYDGVDFAREAAIIRARTADSPVTYTLWEAPEAAPDGGEQQ
jgi:hypothetical protein